MKIEPNSPAFPTDEVHIHNNVVENATGHFGISKREYFIAAALQGFCANPEFVTRLGDKRIAMDPVRIVAVAIEHADMVIEILNSEK
jgi:hypothetical protein